MSACRLRCSLLYTVLALSVILCFVLWSLTYLAQTAYMYHMYHLISDDTNSCSEETSKPYLEALCKEYASGYIAGSLCEPLCTTREIQVQKCIGAHKLKPFVLQAEWNSKSLILKSARHLDPDRIMSSNLLSEMRDGVDIRHNSWSFQLNQEELLRKANATLFKGVLGNKAHTHPVVKLLSESVAAECITKHHMSNGQKLTNIEALNCWQLVASEEYIVAALMQGKPYIPELKGVCGDIYAVEYVPEIGSNEFLGIISQKPWNFRVRLALALLDMIESAEETPYGTLHCCDVKEGNVGLIEHDGKLVTKMIDLDHCWFGPMISSLEFESMISNRTCKHNSDCVYLHCHVECDTTTGKCSRNLQSNNLQILCRRLLTKGHFWQPSLLQNPPTSIKRQLETLLDRCIDPKNILTNIPKDLMRNLHALLSLQIIV